MVFFGSSQQSERQQNIWDHTCLVFASFVMFSLFFMFVWLDLKIGAKFECLNFDFRILRQIFGKTIFGSFSEGNLWSSIKNSTVQWRMQDFSRLSGYLMVPSTKSTKAYDIMIQSIKIGELNPTQSVLKSVTINYTTRRC